MVVWVTICKEVEFYGDIARCSNKLCAPAFVRGVLPWLFLFKVPPLVITLGNTLTNEIDSHTFLTVCGFIIIFYW